MHHVHGACVTCSMCMCLHVCFWPTHAVCLGLDIAVGCMHARGAACVFPCTHAGDPCSSWGNGQTGPIFCAICLHAVLQYQKRVCLVNCIDYLTYQYALHGQNSGFWVKSCKIWHMHACITCSPHMQAFQTTHTSVCVF